jgi:hypothetical protein
MVRVAAFLLAASTAVIGFPAQAATYLFDVDYFGNDIASLAPGSDDPTAVPLSAGDVFTYSLTAVNGEWTTLNTAGFLFFELSRFWGWNSFNLTYALNLNQNSANVFSTSGNASSCCAHLGPTSISVPGGITFDQYVLVGTINSLQTPGPATSILPWPGVGPENNNNRNVTYSAVTAAVVPEPATWAMMLLGFGATGFAMRRSRKTLLPQAA